MKNRRTIHKALCMLMAAVMLVPMLASCAPSLEDPEPSVLSNISFTPQKADEAGVAYDSGFIITATVALSQRELEQNLTVEPEFEYTISKTDGGFILKPEQPLLENTVYSFTLGTKEGRTRTWAFQTRRPFGIVSTTPATDSDEVNTYSGIEIETTHYGVDMTGYLEIDPPVQGHFESRGYTSVFYPDEYFLSNTKYTVTVKKGLESPFGDILAEDYRFSFTTMAGEDIYYGKGERPNYLFGEFSETFLSTDIPLVELGVPQGGNSQTITTGVYKFSGSDQYAEALAAHDAFIKGGGHADQFAYPTDSLEHLVTFSSKLVMKGGYGNAGYVVFDKPLPKGWYLLTLSAPDGQGKNATLQKLIQVSDVSVYTQSLNGETLVWLNSAATGQPINAAGVGVLRPGEKAPTLSATTDKNGIAVLSTKSVQDDAYLITKVDAENEFVDKIPLAEYTEPQMSELYYSFLYKDRELYLPTDNVNFWGRLAPRKEGVKLPAALKAELTGSAWASPADPEAAVLSVPVTLQPDGTFTGKLPIENIASDWYTLRVTDDAGKVYCESGFRVYEYEKPLYVVNVTTQKPFYTAREKVDFNLKSTFYNGTPAPNLAFETHSLGDNPVTVTTDLTGLGTVYINEDKRAFEDHTTWDPFYSSAYFNSTGMEGQYYAAFGQALIFPRDTMLQAERVKNGYQYDLNITTNRVDTSKVQTADDVWANYPQNITGAAVNIPVTVSVYRMDYIKEYADSYYDPINKVTVPFYTYREQQTLENQYTVNTLNGKATLKNLPNPKSSEQYYRIELSCKDTAGMKIENSVYIGYYSDSRDSISDLKYYRYANIKENEADYTGGYRSGYWYNDGSTASYEIGESVDIQLLENSKPVSLQGSMLYTVLQDKILERGVVANQSTFSFAEAEKHLPNITIRGAYFDGRHVYTVDECRANFAPKAREVDITVTPDKPDYRPGDKVNLKITAAGRDGKPVQGDMVISVVDEAMFTLAPQYTDPAQTLYQSVYSYPVASFASYVQHSFYESGGGKGGGGGEGGGDIRDAFKDAAFFQPVTTDVNGAASVSFTLPENLTSWRITTVSVADTGKLIAGVNLTNINAKLPLFVSPVYNTTYVEGDDIAFTARAYGDKVVNITPVDFTATVTGGNKVKEELKTTNTADEYAMFNFGKLGAGDYKATFRVQVGEDTDAVEYPFTVKQSGLQMQVTHEVAPNAVSSLSPLKYPVWLGFYDSQYKDYMLTLNNLLSAAGERADQRVAYAVASKLMRQYAEEDEILPSEDPIDVTDYQNSLGGVRVYSYDSTDVQLTARVAAAAPELFNTQTMIKYFNDVLSYGGWGDNTSAAAAIMGLAALKQPVLTDAKALLKKADVLIDLDFLYLTAALAYLGDTDAAQKAYDTYVAPSIVKNEMWSYYDVTIRPRPVNDMFAGYQTDGTIQSQEAGGKGGSMAPDALTQTGANLKRTALAMLISMKLGQDDTESLLAYIRDNSAYDVATLLEQTAYVNSFVPKTTDTAVVAFNKGLFPTNLELKKYGIRFVPFSKSQLAKSNITVKNGSVGIMASYTGVPGNLSPKASPDISIEKTIRPQAGGSLKAGGLVQVVLKVHLNENAPVGIYNLKEWIPSSLRFDSVDYSSKPDGGIWLDAREGQQLTMCLYRSGIVQTQDGTTPKQRTDYTFTYLARCVTEGDCKIDSTYIVNPASGAVACTKAGEILSVKGFKQSVTKSE